MRRTLCVLARQSASAQSNIVQIRSGTFYREHPSVDTRSESTTNPPLFPDLTFELPATPQSEVGQPNRKDEHWAVIGSTDGTLFLEILRGAHICVPPNARTFPYLSSEEIEKKDHKLRSPFRAIQYVGFNTGKGQSLGSGIRGAYLSARYESRREETDWSVLQYLKGETELNPNENQEKHYNDRLLHQVIKDLRLQKLIDMPVSNLSNGQTRRARIAKALLNEPEVLLLDEPFMGLDPPTLVSLSPLLRDLSYRSSPLLVLGLRPQDPIPDWITHLVVLGQNHKVALMGPKAQVLFSLFRWTDISNQDHHSHARDRPDIQMATRMTHTHGHPLSDTGHELNANGIIPYTAYDSIRGDSSYFNKDGTSVADQLSPADQDRWHSASIKPATQRTLQDLLALTSSLPTQLSSTSQSSSTSQATISTDSPPASNEIRKLGDPIIELQSVIVKYGEKVVLGHSVPQSGHGKSGLDLTVFQGTRLALLGPNGSGKTTLLSLLTSDHPQSYSLPILFFGRSRLPTKGQPGLSLWEIQSRIGHSAPEIHAFFPKRLTIRRTLESAWAETPVVKPKLTEKQKEMVDTYLRWWEPELRPNWSVDPAQSDHDPKSLFSDDTNSFQSLIGKSYPPFPSSSSPSSPSDSLSWAEDPENSFGVLPFGTQRLLLLLRAIIKQPDILILDEAFSGLSAETRDKAMCWLEHGETKFLQSRLVPLASSSASSQSGIDQTATNTVESEGNRWKVTEVPNHRHLVTSILSSLNISSPSEVSDEKTSQEANDLASSVTTSTSNATNHETSPYLFSGLSEKQAMVVVSHVKEEVPPIIDEWLRLPSEEEVSEQGKGVEMGRCDGGRIRTAQGWNEVWQL